MPSVHCDPSARDVRAALRPRRNVPLLSTLALSKLASQALALWVPRSRPAPPVWPAGPRLAVFCDPLHARAASWARCYVLPISKLVLSELESRAPGAPEPALLFSFGPRLAEQCALLSMRRARSDFPAPESTSTRPPAGKEPACRTTTRTHAAPPPGDPGEQLAAPAPGPPARTALAFPRPWLSRLGPGYFRLQAPDSPAPGRRSGSSTRPPVLQGPPARRTTTQPHAAPPPGDPGARLAAPAPGPPAATAALAGTAAPASHLSC
jgi:hypothetical protein